MPARDTVQQTIMLRNEFAVVAVRKDASANGDRLCVEDPRSGNVIYLDPLELERLAAARHEELRSIVAPAGNVLG